MCKKCKRLKWPARTRQPAMPVTVTQMVRTPEQVFETAGGVDHVELRKRVVYGKRF